MGLNSSPTSSPHRSTSEEPKTKLRHCFRFALRTWVTVFLLAALAGLVTHGALRIGGELVKEECRVSSIRQAQYTASRYEDYPERVRAWYDQTAGEPFVSQDALDLTMRKAVRLDPVEQAAGLERLSNIRREGDSILFFAVDPNPVSEGVELVDPSHQYAFLVRNGWVIFFAERRPDDTGWVERGVAYSQYVADFEDYVSGVAILGSMLLVLGGAAGLLVLVALLRYLRAQWNYLTGVTPQPRKATP